MRSLERWDAEGVHPLWNRDQQTVGFTNVLRIMDGRLYVGGAAGLARFDGDRATTLDAGRYPWLSNMTGIVRRNDETWIISDAGIVRIRTQDLEHAFEAPGAAITPTIFGQSEGVRPRSLQGRYADAAVDRNGRLWFATSTGQVRVEPGRVLRNTLAPPVHITRMIADGKPVTGDNVRLPPGTSRVQFDYVALSLTDAGRNRFRVRLEGADKGWINMGARRDAAYLSLRPGRYRFQVIAANPDGVWNTQGASATFSIAPWFWQTWWFRTLVIAVGILGVSALVRWRYRVATAQNRRRIEARLAERERIARDLHDTLLQGFQGLMLRFQAIAQQRAPDDPVRAALDRVLERGDKVLTEGRDRVGALRRETQPVDLEARLRMLAEDVLGERFDWSIEIIGAARRVCAPVADEIAMIVGEALANVVRHSGARSVRIVLRYGRQTLCTQVIDDGAGLPQAVKDAGGREGHFGMTGMRERAVLIGGAIVISNVSPGGCEAKLTIPSAAAYR